MNNKKIFENFLKNQKGMKFRIKQPVESKTAKKFYHDDRI